MRPQDTQAAKATTIQQKELDAEAMEQSAAALANDISDLDAEINRFKTTRSAKHKELRAITSRLVTIKLKTK